MHSKLSIFSSTRGGESAARWSSVLLPHLQQIPSRFTTPLQHTACPGGVSSFEEHVGQSRIFGADIFDAPNDVAALLADTVQKERAAAL